MGDFEDRLCSIGKAGLSLGDTVDMVTAVAEEKNYLAIVVLIDKKTGQKHLAGDVPKDDNDSLIFFRDVVKMLESGSCRTIEYRKQ